MTDADPAALLKFARTAESVHEYNADMPPDSVQTLPEDRRVACAAKATTGFPSSAQLECSGPQHVTVAITREQYARLVELMTQSCPVAQTQRADPRYIGEELRRAAGRMGPTPEEIELMRRYLFAAVQSGKVTSVPVASTSSTAGQVLDAVLQLPQVQVTTGVLSGFAVSFVPLGGPISDLAQSSGVIESGSRLQCGGKALGEIIGGITQVAIGCGGIGLGTGTTSTGGGAPAGIWLVSESAVVVGNGVVTTASAAGTLWNVVFDWKEDVVPTTPEASAPPTKSEPSAKPNEAKPAPQAKSPEAKPPTTPAPQQSAGQTPLIRNQHLAGKKHPKTGVPFDQEGYPDFKAAGVVKAEVRIKVSGEHKKDVVAANHAAKLDKTPEGYTWHHHQDGTTMQLVPRQLHEQTGHTGGIAGIRQKQ